MTDVGNEQPQAFAGYGGGESGQDNEVWPFQQKETAGPQPAAEHEDAAADVRQQAAALIADALMQAQEMVQGPGREADKRMVEEAVSGLRSLGEYLERCVDSLTAERTQIEGEIHSLRDLVEELSGTVHSLREGAMAAPAPEAVAVEEEMPEPVEAYEEPAPPPPPTFESGAPVSVQVHEVSNFNLLVRIERILSGHEAVLSAGIESYQEEQARFVLTLREPVTGEEIQSALQRDLDQEVAIEKMNPEWNELVLRLKKDSPAVSTATDPWGHAASDQHTNGSWGS
jgi:hypothetical protein